jgi:hypothetical protein
MTVVSELRCEVEMKLFEPARGLYAIQICGRCMDLFPGKFAISLKSAHFCDG